MKIATWNLDTSNKRQIYAIEFLLGLEVDVACLQELRSDTIEYLKRLKQFQLHSCVSYYQNGTSFFSAILSKIPIEHAETHQFRSLQHTFLTRFTGRDVGKNFFHYSDFLVGGKNVRVFNLHLPSGVSPSLRNVLLKQVLKKQHSDINIVCGDFNSFGHFPWNFLMGPFNGSGWKDYIQNELTILRSIIEKYNLKLSIPFAITYPRFKTHIDHIMVPDYWLNFFSRTFEERHGSDHKLVIMEETETSEERVSL